MRRSVRRGLQGLLGWIVGGGLVATAGAVGLEDFNRVVNGTVEAEGPPGTPAHWTASSAGDALALWDTSVYVSPTHNLSFDDNDAAQAAQWVSDPFDVQQGELLVLSYFADYLVIEPGSFTAEVRFFDSGGASAGSVQDGITGTLPIGPTPMAYRTLRTRVPVGAVTADVRLSSGTTGNTGFAFYDDISVDENRLLNGRAEVGGDGVGVLAEDWFFGPFTSWEQVSDAPSGFSVLRIDDPDITQGTDWRSKAIDITRAVEVTFGVKSKRTNLVGGDAQVVLRFGTGADAVGNLTGEIEGGIVVIPLAGDTVGFESLSMTVTDVPPDATHVDMLLSTQNEVGITGTLDFDDAFVVATLAPEPGDINGDGAVDAEDALLLAGCMGGPDNPPLCGEPESTRADLDADADVDLADMAVMQGFFAVEVSNNLITNPDFETPSDPNNPIWPLQWFHSSKFGGDPDDPNNSNCKYADNEEYISPTHALKIDDQSTADGEFTEWRSAGAVLPEGVTALQVEWNWLYENVDGDFFMTLAFWDGVDEYGNATGTFYGEQSILTEQGTSDGWMFNSIVVPIPAGAGAIDMRFRSWGKAGVGPQGATGIMYIDDVNVAPAP